MKNLSHIILIISCSLIIDACSLQPLYGKKNYKQNSNLQHIYVENIPEREGQFLRTKISQILSSETKNKTKNKKLYNLKISISESETLISNNYQNRDKDWWQIRFIVDITLLDNNFSVAKEQSLADIFTASENEQVKKVIIRKKFIELGVVTAGYSPISFTANKNKTKELMLQNLANKIFLELTLVFQKNDNKT